MATEEFNDDLPIDSPERKRLPLLLRRAWYGLNQAFRRQISHAGATPDQFTALRTLCEGDPAGLTQSELTRAMSSDPNTVASLLERMENNGWLPSANHVRLIAAPSASSSCPTGRENIRTARLRRGLAGRHPHHLPADRRDSFRKNSPGGRRLPRRRR